MTRTVEVSFCHPLTGADLVATCEVTPGMPGNLSGPPERCWPEEPPDVQAELERAGPWYETWLKVCRGAVDILAAEEDE
jgi:hypothetical protein